MKPLYSQFMVLLFDCDVLFFLQFILFDSNRFEFIYISWNRRQIVRERKKEATRKKINVRCYFLQSEEANDLLSVAHTYKHIGRAQGI